MLFHWYFTFTKTCVFSFSLFLFFSFSFCVDDGDNDNNGNNDNDNDNANDNDNDNDNDNNDGVQIRMKLLRVKDVSGAALCRAGLPRGHALVGCAQREAHSASLFAKAARSLIDTFASHNNINTNINEQQENQIEGNTPPLPPSATTTTTTSATGKWELCTVDPFLREMPQKSLPKKVLFVLFCFV